MSAPRVLVSGVVLGQAMGGVSRRAREILPRAAGLLAREGGALTVLEGRQRIPFALPETVERLASDVPAGPPLVRAMAEGAALGALLRERRFDLLDFGHLPVPRGFRVPYALTIHDLRRLALAHTPMSRRLVARTVIGRALRAAALVIAPSETVRAELAERWPACADRTAVVPNAGDHFTPLPRRPAPDAPLLHVGHLEPRKNIELLLAALAHDPTLPPLVLAGAAKPGEDERLRAMARDMGVAARVTFLGAFADERLPELYASAACAVIPSRVEGFGIGVLEAQRARCPLAIAEAGALREVAGPDVPGFAVDDAAGCAAAMWRAIAAAYGVDESARYSWDGAARGLVAAWTRAAAGLAGN